LYIYVAALAVKEPLQNLFTHPY